MNIVSSRNFDKQFRKLPQKIKKQFSKRLEIFLIEPSNSQLNLHKLGGKYDELWSINITGDVRAILDRSFKNTILFVAIGHHSELYE